MTPPSTAPRSTLDRTLFHGSLWTGSGRILSIVQVFLFNVALARLLAPGDYGGYVIALSIVSLGVTVGVLGLDQACVRLVSEATSRGRWDEVRRTVRIVLGLSAVGAAAVALAYLALHRRVTTGLFDVPVLAPLGVALALWLFVAVAQRQLAEIFRGLQNIPLATLFGGIKSTGILTSLTQLGLVAVLWVFWIPRLAPLVWGIVALTGGIAVVAGVTLAARLGALPATPDAPAGEAERGPRTVAVVSLALPLLAISVLMIGRAETDIWLVGALAGSESVAGYGASVRLSALVYTPLMVVSGALAPLLAEAQTRGGRGELERTVRVAAAAAFVPALLGAVGLLLLAEPILGLVFGDFYRASAPVLRLLTVGHLINVLGGPNALLLSMRGQQVPAMWGMVVTVVYVVAAGWFLGRLGGAVGVAVASASGLLLQNVILTGLARRRLGVWTLPLASPSAVAGAVRAIWPGSRRSD